MFKFTEAEKRVLALFKKKAKKENPFIFIIVNEMEGLQIKSDKTVKNAIRVLQAKGLIKYDSNNRKQPIIKVL